jgi:hypothetical protein
MSVRSKSTVKWAVGISAAVGVLIAFPFWFVDMKLKQPMRPSPLSPAGVRSVRTELYKQENQGNDENPFRDMQPGGLKKKD